MTYIQYSLFICINHVFNTVLGCNLTFLPETYVVIELTILRNYKKISTTNSILLQSIIIYSH